MNISRLVLLATKIFIPSSIVSVRAVKQDVNGFSFVGEGFCQDKDERYYDYMSPWSAKSHDDCGSLCLGSGVDGLVGIEATSSTCYCLFEDNYVPSILPIGFVGVNINYKGTGDIENFKNNTGSYCYEINVSDTEFDILQAKRLF